MHSLSFHLVSMLVRAVFDHWGHADLQLQAMLGVGEFTSRAHGTMAGDGRGSPAMVFGILVGRIQDRFPGAIRPTSRVLAAFMVERDDIERLVEKYEVKLRPFQLSPPSTYMLSAGWPVPVLDTVGDLALWCGLSVGELFHLADPHFWERLKSDTPLQHYRYHLHNKQSGGQRLIEAPKLRLKTLQRRILDRLLCHIPPHPAAHGFVRGRNVRSFVEPHTGQDVTLRVDLENFFPSISKARVAAIFRYAGYTESVARLLTAAVTNVCPRQITAPPELRRLYDRPHLPQGAPTSPAIANLCCYRLDCRLTGLCKAAGAVYTRYADDLAFSGDASFARGVERFQQTVNRIILEEGFDPHFRKSRIMRASQCQKLAGVVVNTHPNLSRSQYDLLKAMLHQTATQGQERANRDQHPDWRGYLLGKIAWVRHLNPAKGQKLQHLFETIVW